MKWLFTRFELVTKAGTILTDRQRGNANAIMGQLQPVQAANLFFQSENLMVSKSEITSIQILGSAEEEER